MERTLTVEEAADRLGLHTSTTYRRLQSGRLDGFKEGGEWRIPVEAVERETERFTSSFKEYRRKSEAAEFLKEHLAGRYVAAMADLDAACKRVVAASDDVEADADSADVVKSERLDQWLATVSELDDALRRLKGIVAAQDVIRDLESDAVSLLREVDEARREDMEALRERVDKIRGNGSEE